MISTYKKFIRNNDDVVSFIKNNYNNKIKNEAVIYNGIIISIYGNLENYIDSIFYELLKIYFKYSNKSLPGKLLSKYKKYFADNLINPQRYGLDIHEKDLIRDYLNILELKYQNIESKELFLKHPGNLKAEKIIQLMAEFDINEPKLQILNDSVFKNFYTDIVGLDDNDFATKKDKKSDGLFKYVDEIVDQRNYIAHGSDNYNRIKVDDITCYNVPFINCFGKTILKVLLKKSALYSEQNTYSSIKLLKIFDKKILCLHISGIRISKNDYIVYKIKDDTYISEIIRIEINHNEIEFINNDECDIGIEIDDRLNSSDGFELLEIINVN
ncbi:MAG: hypothetical protein IJP71_03105 [Lachnospiraceae bacterium]|nr:hypothetical protein [Lachnospiraceae bacterium]